jgi:hypothetical protein
MTLRKKDRQVAIYCRRQARDVRRMQHLHTGVQLRSYAGDSRDRNLMRPGGSDVTAAELLGADISENFLTFNYHIVTLEWFAKTGFLACSTGYTFTRSRSLCNISSRV